ncbi:MAG TPA: tryptophan synthase subunit alpha [Longimicrobiales bacterium]|nr:tryptophan synthase subunit alpha [Longimicrobiales bacterium]
MESASPTTSPSRAGALEERLLGLRRAGRRALIPYLTAGFPRREDTLPLLDSLAAAGADVLELGVPFSDPLADGPTIQRASQRALDGGATPAWVLETLAAFRRGHDTPVVLFTYLNPILAYGPERFLTDAAEAGADGLLLTDLPVGSDPELEGLIEASPLALVRLVAPTTPRERALEIAHRSQGFLYYVSRTGVTGARAELRDALTAEVETLRSATDLPIAVGFGISTPEQAATVARVADGVVVGSALIDVIERGGLEAGAELIAGMRRAMDGAG